MKRILTAVAAAIALTLGSMIPAHAYPSGSGEVGTVWGVVTGSKTGILITLRGVAEGTTSNRLQVSVTNPRGFTRNLFAVRTNSSGEFRLRVGGLKWTPGTYKVNLQSGSVKQSLGVFVSQKRVRG